MDAVLTPNASLSPAAFNLVMIIIALISFICGVMFMSMGAWPVLGFFGLDVLALYAAFRFVRRRARQETRVRITAEQVDITHTDSKGIRTASFPPAFARVELDEPTGPTSWLRIEHGRTAYVIGRFLTPKERKALARGLREALQRARCERAPA